MLNLIPVVMFLLMQGAGGTDLSVRQQQALLDLAHRAFASQSQGEIERALATSAGMDGADLAFWVQVFSTVGAEPEPVAPEQAALFEPVAVVPPEAPTASMDGWARQVKPRDGPALG